MEAQNSFAEFVSVLQEKIRSQPPEPKTSTQGHAILAKNGVDLSEIANSLARILASNSISLEKVDNQSFVSLLSLQLAAILVDSEDPTFMKQIQLITSQYLTNLFELHTTKSVYYARNESEAIIKVCRAALDRKYESLQNEGFPVLYSRPPVFYVPESQESQEMANLICQSFLLPSGCVRIVSLEKDSNAVDVNALESLIKEDIGDGKTPTLILSRGVVPFTGESDDLNRIRQVCDNYNIWMHLEGDSSALLLWSKPAGSVTSIISSDSITTNPGKWFKIYGAPLITFFKSAQITQSPRECFPQTLPLWMFLQSMGQNLLKMTINHIVETSRHLFKRLSSNQHIETIERAIDSQFVLFRFKFPSDVEQSHNLVDVENKITNQIHLVLQDQAIKLGIDCITHSNKRFMRFQPFSSTTGSIQQDQLNAYLDALLEECDLVISTLRLKNAFKLRVEKEKGLKYVDLGSGWFGLGAIRCTPSYIGEEDNISEEVNKDIDELNESVVEELSKLDPKLFSKGKAPGTNFSCILIGVDRKLTTEESVSHLVEEIAKKSGELEKSGKFLDNLAQVIRKGIIEAESQLQKETEDKILEEGFIKYIPIVGSLYSMFATTEEGKKPSGRTFSLPKAKLDKVNVISRENNSIPNSPVLNQSKPEVPYLREKAIAISAVEHACQACKKVFNALVTSETITKKDNSPVTVADYCSQAIINLSLSSAFPNDLIVAEEDSQELRVKEAEKLKNRVVEITNEILNTKYSEEDILNAIDLGNYSGGNGRFWTLDPIDGTKGFLRGEQYAVCLSLIVDGEVVLGVMGCPNLPVDMNLENSEVGCIFAATKSGGAFERPLSGGSETPIHVSQIANSSEAKFCESVEASHSSHGDASKVADLLQITQPPMRIDSQCKYAAIARGDASIYLRLPTQKAYEEKIWDHASGYIIVKEAGGEVQDVNGKSIDFSLGRTLAGNSGIVATNGKIQENVVQAVMTVIRGKQQEENLQ